ncbi:MAG: hypothetical protein ACQKBT_10680 [Puniceicoccales bacterium]
MTGLFRTSLFFFLPIFAGLLVYHTWIDQQPSPAEMRQAFREEYSDALNAANSTAESYLKDEKTGRLEMPADLASFGVVIAEVVTDSIPELTLIPAELLKAGTWTLTPDPRESSSYASNYRFLLKPTNGGPEMHVVLYEDTVYQPDGNPSRLNVYLKEKTQPDHE